MVGVVTRSVGLHRGERSTLGGAPTPARSAARALGSWSQRVDLIPPVPDADRCCCSLVGTSIVMEVPSFHDAQVPDRRLSLPDYVRRPWRDHDEGLVRSDAHGGADARLGLAAPRRSTVASAGPPCFADRMNPGGGRVRDRVEVRCYAGGKGEETPRAVLLGGREVTVRMEQSWIEEPVGWGGTARRRVFQVGLEDGRRCRLAQEPDGSWTLARTVSGR
jgi:hypothetical protein